MYQPKKEDFINYDDFLQNFAKISQEKSNQTISSPLVNIAEGNKARGKNTISSWPSKNVTTLMQRFTNIISSKVDLKERRAFLDHIS